MDVGPRGWPTMFPDPAQQASQQAFNDAVRRQANDRHMDAMRRRSSRNGGRSGSGLGGLLQFLVLVVGAVVLVRNPELRADLWTFAQNVWADVQRLWADAQSR
ncbi:hypothetical protein [Streptomyces sp. G45]|uniref:hypothetical protein n=1 Tax=Streptomyces sp. G45 TaxID=3406627 RepID=UPI003C1EF847